MLLNDTQKPKKRASVGSTVGGRKDRVGGGVREGASNMPFSRVIPLHLT